MQLWYFIKIIFFTKDDHEIPSSNKHERHFIYKLLKCLHVSLRLINIVTFHVIKSMVIKIVTFHVIKRMVYIIITNRIKRCPPPLLIVLGTRFVFVCWIQRRGGGGGSFQQLVSSNITRLRHTLNVNVKLKLNTSQIFFIQVQGQRHCWKKLLLRLFAFILF